MKMITFRQIIISLVLFLSVTGCKKGQVPAVSTTIVTKVIASSATSGGVIISDGSSSVTVTGVCWSTDEEPTTADNKTIDVAADGIFTSNITGLSEGTEYFVRAYATNSEGTGYGIARAFITFGEVDPYKSIDISFEGWKVESHKFNFHVQPYRLLFTSPSNGYLIGTYGSIFHTTDSGKNWIPQTSGTTLTLSSIFFLNENVGFISGRGMNCLDPDCNKGSIFLKTLDGGEHWTKILYGSTQYFESMRFRDENNGIAIMEINQVPNQKHKFLASTNDGGLTWIKVDVNIPQTYSVNINSYDNVSYILGSDQNILKSIDYGAHWQSLITPVSQHNLIFYHMVFINENIGFITDHMDVYKTEDGGESWKVMNFPLSLSHSGMPVINDFTGMHFINENEGSYFGPIELYETGEFPTFKGTYIYTTNNGGNTWTSSELYKEFSLGLMSYPGPDIGYIASNTVIKRLIRK
jgi:photosystem II stability/assembly factor-like uncharacterized protein